MAKEKIQFAESLLFECFCDIPSLHIFLPCNNYANIIATVNDLCHELFYNGARLLNIIDFSFFF